MTGESARQRAEMLRAAGDPQAEKWFAGAIGERRVAETLESLATNWTVIHDRLLMPGITESNLDHVLVGPPGVVLVDAKNYSGDITVWGDSLFQHLGSGEYRSSRNLQREVKKVQWMAVQVSTRLGTPVTPVLCLTGNRSDRFGEPQFVCGVWVVALATLVQWLSRLPARATEEEIRRLTPRVLSEFPSTMTDPELLAVIGRDLARIAPGRPVQAVPRRTTDGAAGRPATAATSSRSRTGRRARGRLVRLTVVAGLLVWGVDHADSVSSRLGEVLASAVTGALEATPRADGTPSMPTPPMPTPPADVPGGERLDCAVLSAERLSTYVQIPVMAWHGEDGVCRWLADSSDVRPSRTDLRPSGAAGAVDSRCRHPDRDPVALAVGDPPGTARYRRHAWAADPSCCRRRSQRPSVMHKPGSDVEATTAYRVIARENTAGRDA